MPKIKPLTFDPTHALVSPHGITQAQLDALKDKLNACRTEVLGDVLGEDAKLYADGTNVPPENQPLDAGFVEMPERILDAYQTDRENSELGRILKTAKRLGEMVDKVVVLGIGGSYMGARALMESCCHPYHNSLGRDQRGGKPRMYFEGNNVDNDWSQALLEFLETDSQGDGPEGKWAIVVISKSGGTLETAAALRQFYAKLQSAVGQEKLADYIVPVTGEAGKTCIASRRDWVQGTFFGA